MQLSLNSLLIIGIYGGSTLWSISVQLNSLLKLLQLHLQYQAVWPGGHKILAKPSLSPTLHRIPPININITTTASLLSSLSPPPAPQYSWFIHHRYRSHNVPCTAVHNCRPGRIAVSRQNGDGDVTGDGDSGVSCGSACG